MTKVTSGVVDGPRPITCDIFVSPVLTRDDLLNGPGLTPLRSAHAREEGHLFIYGPFYATLNIGCAYRYAVRNPYRSELLHAIADGLQF
jgi:hypothetical protein